jgi:hypothetical protein
MMRMNKESLDKKSACMIKEATLLLMVLRRLLLLKRDKHVILSWFSMINCQIVSTVGTPKLDLKMKKIINQLCNSNLIFKKERRAVKFMQQFLRSEVISRLSFFSELLVVKVISKYSIWF